MKKSVSDFDASYFKQNTSDRSQQYGSHSHPCQITNIWIKCKRRIKYLRCFYRYGSSSHPVSCNDHKFSRCYAASFHYRTPDTWLSEADTICGSPDFQILPAAWRFLYDPVFIFRRIFRKLFVSQPDCRYLYSHYGIYLPFFIPQYDSHQCIKRTWQIRNLSDSQYDQYLYPGMFCIICYSGFRNTWISVWNSLWRACSYPASYVCIIRKTFSLSTFR